MSNIFFRVYLFIFALTTQCFFAQNTKDSLSDGTLKINSTEIPVKIYSTADVGNLNNFADLKTNHNTLVILNKANLETSHLAYSINILEKFKNENYQFFDEDFKLIENTKANWGMMSAQHMVEHIEKGLRIASGEIQNFEI